MAIYTTLIRSIVEQRQADEHVGPDNFSVAYATLGLDRYPIFDENYRATLNDKIIRHYYFREIGFETVAQFRWYMDATMRENMAYFNQLYDSLNLIVDPITNVRYTYTDVTNLETLDTSSSESSRTGSLSHNSRETHTGDDVTDATKGTTETESMQHGKTTTDTYQHGHTLTDTNTYGKTIHVVDDTHYGRTEKTENSGHDDVLEGTTHERTIRSDTPMNQITNQGVENLNYATEVDYVDREGVAAGRTTFGGITDVTFGGSDVTTTDTTDGGTDSATHAHTGTDTDTKAETGTDTTTTTHAGTDTTTLTHGEIITGNEGTSTTEGAESGSERSIDTDTTKTHTGSGYQGTSPATLLEEYRKTFINVDMQVIASLDKLFFGLWG